MSKPKSKTCTGCHQRKLIKDYPKSSKAKDGYSQYCRKCRGKMMVEGKAQAKAQREQEAAVSDAKMPLASAMERRIAIANAALSKTNGAAGSQRSPIRKLMKELHKVLADQGAEVESINFEGSQCRVTYKKTEVFDL